MIAEAPTSFSLRKISAPHTHTVEKKQNKRETPEIRESKEEDGWIHRRTFCVIIF